MPAVSLELLRVLIRTSSSRMLPLASFSSLKILSSSSCKKLARSSILLHLLLAMSCVATHYTHVTHIHQNAHQPVLPLQHKPGHTHVLGVLTYHHDSSADAKCTRQHAACCTTAFQKAALILAIVSTSVLIKPFSVGASNQKQP